MTDLFLFFIKSPYIRLMFYLLILLPLYGYKEHIDPQKIALWLFLSTMILISLALLETLVFQTNWKLYRYKNLAKLIILTRKLEYKAEKLGGRGKGLYEKVASLEDRVSQECIKKTYEVATIRNNTMHGDPKIKDTKKLYQKINFITQELKKASTYQKKSVL